MAINMRFILGVPSGGDSVKKLESLAYEDVGSVSPTYTFSSLCRNANLQPLGYLPGRQIFLMRSCSWGEYRSERVSK